MIPIKTDGLGNREKQVLLFYLQREGDSKQSID